MNTVEVLEESTIAEWQKKQARHCAQKSPVLKPGDSISK
jgi:hypothetical protein